MKKYGCVYEVVEVNASTTKIVDAGLVSAVKTKDESQFIVARRGVNGATLMKIAASEDAKLASRS